MTLLIKKGVSKFKKDMSQKTNKKNYEEHHHGDTVVQYKKDDNVDHGGEYVDFEDLKDDS